MCSLRGAAILGALLIAAAGCQQPPVSPARPPPQPTARQRTTTAGPRQLTVELAGSQPAEETPSSRPVWNTPIVLRRALLPPIAPQPFLIELHERRVISPGSQHNDEVHELSLHLAGALGPETDADARAARGTLAGTLVLEHIQVTYTAPAGPRLDYNSDASPTADKLDALLRHVTGAQLQLEVTQTGRLHGLHGLDAIWRKADLLVPPPDLRRAQELFRDSVMADLVSEALFPPMPSAPLRAGDRWQMQGQIQMAPNFPPLGRLTSTQTGRIIRVEESAQGFPVIWTQLTGQIEFAEDALPSRALQPRSNLTAASHEIAQVLDWNQRALSQNSRQDIALLVHPERPAGGQPSDVSIRDMRTLISHRGGVPMPTAASATPASAPQ